VARGNIYVVGDLTYHCPDSNGACKITDGTNPSYRNSEGLPKLALLAGGSIIVGDYDHPDFRANRSQFNLINDQVGQSRQPSVPAAGGIANNLTWLYQTVPGQTGTNMTNNSGGNMGFAPMIAAFGNQSSRPATRPVFQSAPFGFLLARGGFGAYEGTQINTAGRAITTLSPSNGPLRTGDQSNTGMVRTQITNAALGCTAIAQVATNAPLLPTLIANNINTAPLHMGYWCPPNTGKYFRTWNGSGNSSGPAGDTATWVAQHPSNAGLDNNTGMTTGWLAGALQFNPVAGGFDTLGDLSQTKLLKLMWMVTMETTADRDPNIAGTQAVGPLRTDGLLYSANSLFAVARFFADQRGTVSAASISNTQARWLHHGSLLSYELGFLLTGNATNSTSQFTVNRTDAIDFTPADSSSGGGWNKGPAMGVFWDERLVGLLGFGGKTMSVSRGGVFTQVAR
jgi:hypothetical protein